VTDLDSKIDAMIAAVPESAWEEASYRQWLREMYRAMDFLMRSGAWGAVDAYIQDQQMTTEDSEPGHCDIAIPL